MMVRLICLVIAAAAGCGALILFFTAPALFAFSMLPLAAWGGLLSMFVNRIPLFLDWERPGLLLAGSLWAIQAIAFWSVAGWVTYHEVPRMVGPSFVGYVVGLDQRTRQPVIEFRLPGEPARLILDDRNRSRRKDRPAPGSKVNVIETFHDTFAVSTRDEGTVFWSLFSIAAVAGAVAGSFALVALNRYAGLGKRGT